jgi:hypothetical protein
VPSSCKSDTPSSTPAADASTGADGGCPDPCGKDAIANVTQCCGKEIYDEATKANGGKAPNLVIGTPSAGFGGETDTSTGTITVNSTLDKCQQTQVMLFELCNLASTGRFSQIDSDAAAGNLSREDYTRATEREEYNNLKKAAAAEAKCMNKWGCAGQTPRHAWVGASSDFDDYYNNHLAESHKNHYRNAWDSLYKAAYDAKHPPAGP